MIAAAARLATFVLAIACGAVACGPDDPGTGPPDLRYGEVACARCGMSVDRPRFAAALRYQRPDGGAALAVYDDVGELFLAVGEAENLDVREVWVHDAPSDAWIAGESAFYVQGKIRSPMGLGIEAYGNRAAAEGRAVEVRGAVLDFNALLARSREGALKSRGEED
ncbi:MAG: nitrous oxide reductase accessory protein NosL [Myxococcota bacterium]